MKGKFIFCLSGTDSWKNYYATMDIHDVKRNCFVDSDISASSPNATPPEAGSIVFFNFHIYQEDVSAWRVSIPKFAKTT